MVRNEAIVPSDAACRVYGADTQWFPHTPSEAREDPGARVRVLEHLRVLCASAPVREEPHLTWYPLPVVYSGIARMGPLHERYTG